MTASEAEGTNVFARFQTDVSGSNRAWLLKFGKPKNSFFNHTVFVTEQIRFVIKFFMEIERAVQHKSWSGTVESVNRTTILERMLEHPGTGKIVQNWNKSKLRTSFLARVGSFHRQEKVRDSLHGFRMLYELIPLMCDRNGHVPTEGFFVASYLKSNRISEGIDLPAPLLFSFIPMSSLYSHSGHDEDNHFVVYVRELQWGATTSDITIDGVSNVDVGHQLAADIAKILFSWSPNARCTYGSSTRFPIYCHEITNILKLANVYVSVLKQLAQETHYVPKYVRNQNEIALRLKDKTNSLPQWSPDSQGMYVPPLHSNANSSGSTFMDGESLAYLWPENATNIRLCSLVTVPPGQPDNNRLRSLSKDDIVGLSEEVQH